MTLISLKEFVRLAGQLGSVYVQRDERGCAIRIPDGRIVLEVRLKERFVHAIQITKENA